MSACFIGFYLFISAHSRSFIMKSSSRSRDLIPNNSKSHRHAKETPSGMLLAHRVSLIRVWTRIVPPVTAKPASHVEAMRPLPFPLNLRDGGPGQLLNAVKAL